MMDGTDGIEARDKIRFHWGDKECRKQMKAFHATMTCKASEDSLTVPATVLSLLRVKIRIYLYCVPRLMYELGTTYSPDGRCYSD